MTCTRSKMYFKNQKEGLEEGLTKQNVHLVHCIYESEAHNWSAGFPSAHALWSRVFSVHCNGCEQCEHASFLGS